MSLSIIAMGFALAVAVGKIHFPLTALPAVWLVGGGFFVAGLVPRHVFFGR